MRLFLSLVPPGPVRALLRDRMQGLVAARWQSDAQLHATLRFIGETDRHGAEALLLALGAERFTRIEARLDGFGWFDRRDRVDQLWAGLAPRDSLAALHARLDRLCVPASSKDPRPRWPYSGAFDKLRLSGEGRLFSHSPITPNPSSTELNTVV